MSAFISPLENRLMRRLEAQRDGVISAIAAAKASQIVADQALSGNTAAQQALIYASEHPQMEPEISPWAIATVSVTQRLSPLEPEPAKLFYKKFQMSTEKPTSFRQMHYDGGNSWQAPIQYIEHFLPRLVVQAWDIDAMCYGVIREAHGGRLSLHIDDSAALVDITKLDPPDDISIPENPESWERRFMEVHARYCPSLELSLALPAAIIRHGRRATYAHIVNLIPVDKGGLSYAHRH